MDIGVDVARKYKESETVIHAIQAHHGDVEAKTVIACIVQAADAISAARPGARRENLENYIKRLEKLEEVASSFDGVERCYAIQAGREIRVMVKPEVISDDKMILLARDICKRSRATSNIQARLRSTLFVKAARSNTQNKRFRSGQFCPLFHSKRRNWTCHAIK